MGGCVYSGVRELQTLTKSVDVLLHDGAGIDTIKAHLYDLLNAIDRLKITASTRLNPKLAIEVSDKLRLEPVTQTKRASMIFYFCERGHLKKISLRAIYFYG